MSIPFFNDVLAALGKRLNYESISNLYGNSFCKDAQKYISQANPLMKINRNKQALQTMFKDIKVIKTQNAEDKKKAIETRLGGEDLSWAEGFLS